MRCETLLLCAIWSGLCLPAAAQSGDPKPEVRQTVVGPLNNALAEGADQLRAGNAAEGVRLMRQALATAGSAREINVAYSNLCAGFILLREYREALRNCDIALARSPNNHHALSNRALAHFYLKDYDAAQRDLNAGLAIAPQSSSLRKVGRLIRDTLDPVRPSVVIEYGQGGDDGR